MKDRIDRLEAAEREIERVEAERDALVAHNTRLLRLRNQYDSSNVKPGDAIAELLAIIDETPEASATRLKAEWQAEAFSNYLKTLPFDTTRLSPIDLNIEAKRLRRQAEDPA